MTKREQIAEVDAAILTLPDYFDDALVGLSLEEVVVYDEDKVIDILMQHDEMTWEDAVEHYAYNIRGSMGEGFPIYVRTFEEEG